MNKLLKKANPTPTILMALLAPILFLTYKLSALHFRLGDGNAYFYMAQQILSGQIPYQDFLLADPPLLPYLLAGIKLVIGSKLILFQAVPSLLEALTAFFLYLLLKQKNHGLAFLAPIIYLSSFLILSTSDFVTGLHFVNLFIVVALILDQKNPAYAGFFWALASLVKLYVIPGLLGWLVFKLLAQPKPQLKKFLLGYAITVSCIMLPFIILSFKQVLDYTLIHQFNRPAGLNKGHVLSFFLKKDWLLIILSTIGLILSKKKKLLLPLISWLIFFALFRDLYYLYLGVLAPWLTWSIFTFFSWLQSHWQSHWRQYKLGHNAASIILILIFLNSILVINLYEQQFKDKGLLIQGSEVAQFVKNQEPDLPLYGKHESTPLIALLANKNLFDNQIDTNTQLFASGALDKKRLSQKAAEHGVYLVTQVADIPQNKNVDSGHHGFFSDEVFHQSCQRLKIFAGSGHELVNDIAVYRCQK